jgi:putative tryptophan/tyrosine transport system substrate-binding protein
MPSRDTARIGIITAGPGLPVKGFREGLGELGWTEGQNVDLELRAAQGQLDRLPGFASEMVDLGVDLIDVVGVVTARAARNATSTIPIIFAVVADPVAAGLVASLQRPDGNATGVTTFDPQQARTQLEFLKMVRPTLLRVAILSGSDISSSLEPKRGTRIGPPAAGRSRQRAISGFCGGLLGHEA